MTKNVIIIGASRGIGFECVKLFLEKGYNVLAASSSIDNLNKASSKIIEKNYSGNFDTLRCDISNDEDVKVVFEKCKKLFSQVDIVINAAAIIQNQQFVDLNINDWQKMVDINLKGTVLSCYYAFKYMKQNGGNIVNISSLAGLQNFEKFPGFSSYVTTKFAVTGLTEALAVEGKDYGIRVNALAPGAVDTEMLQKAAPGLESDVKPEDIAKNIIYLCDDEQCHHVTGTILTINCNS